MQLTKEFQEPYTDKLLPPGTYSFTVKEAALFTSKKGKISIKVQLSFVNDNNFTNKFTVWDYLGADPAWKFRSFLRAVGLEALESHPIIEPWQLKGASGVAKLRIDKSEEYGDKNTVQAYKVQKGVAKAAPAPTPQTQQQKDEAFINQAQKSEAKKAAEAKYESDLKQYIYDRTAKAAHDGEAKIEDEDIPF